MVNKAHLSASEGRKNISKGVFFVACCFLLLLFLKERSEFPVWSSVILSLLVGLSISSLLIALGILSHEAIHNNLHPNKKVNDFFGIIFSAASLLPYFSGKKLHLDHHKYGHRGESDPEYSFHKGSVAWFILSGALRYSQLHFKELRRRIQSWQRLKRRQKREVYLDIISLVVTFGVVVAFCCIMKIPGLLTLLAFHLTMPFVFAIRYAADHRGLPKVVSHSNTKAYAWVVNTHSFVEWFWSHINYHGVHHLYPSVPHGRLKDVYLQTNQTVVYPTLPNGYLKSFPSLLKRPYFG